MGEGTGDRNEGRMDEAKGRVKETGATSLTTSLSPKADRPGKGQEASGRRERRRRAGQGKRRKRSTATDPLGGDRDRPAS
jgi:hypothetical protein